MKLCSLYRHYSGLNSAFASSKRYVYVSTPRTCGWDFIWKKVFVEGIKLRILGLDHLRLASLAGWALNINVL